MSTAQVVLQGFSIVFHSVTAFVIKVQNQRSAKKCRNAGAYRCRKQKTEMQKSKRKAETAKEDSRRSYPPSSGSDSKKLIWCDKA